jgi:hypothetical protein
MPGGSILITRAPKSDITVAAAGPAMKLAQSITSRSLNRFAGIHHSPAALLLGAPSALPSEATLGPTSGKLAKRSQGRLVKARAGD